jgi:hypothetical protein
MDVDHQPVLERILDHWPDIVLVGCTTDGEISEGYPCTDDSLALLLIHSENISFAAGVGENLSSAPETALRKGRDQARQGLPGEPELGIILCEGLKTFGVHLGQALRAVLGEMFPVFGACAGDHYQFQTTYQFHGSQVLTDAAVLVLLSGPVCFSMRLRSGWSPAGKIFQATGVTDNVVRYIDNLPAVDFFQKYVGPHAEGYAQFPLAVMTGDAEDDFVLRDPVSINEKDGSIVFVGTFPEAPRVRLTEFCREALLQGAERAIRETIADFSSAFPGVSPELALTFPCTSRRHILGTQAGKEHALLMQSHLPNFPWGKGLRLFGMYAYGEFGPTGTSGMTCFHNDTYAILLLGEMS